MVYSKYSLNCLHSILAVLVLIWFFALVTILCSCNHYYSRYLPVIKTQCIKEVGLQCGPLGNVNLVAIQCSTQAMLYSLSSHSSLYIVLPFLFLIQREWMDYSPSSHQCWYMPIRSCQVHFSPGICSVEKMDGRDNFIGAKEGWWKRGNLGLIQSYALLPGCNLH